MHDNDEEKRIEELKRQAEQMGMVGTWDSGDLSSEVAGRAASGDSMAQMDPHSAWHLQFTSGSDEDTDAFLRYYAVEHTRRLWLVDFPDDVMPPHEELPYDRDRHLPAPY